MALMAGKETGCTFAATGPVYFSSWKAKRLTQAMAMVETTKTMCTMINLVR